MKILKTKFSAIRVGHWCSRGEFSFHAFLSPSIMPPSPYRPPFQFHQTTFLFGNGLINYVDTKGKCRHLKNWPVHCTAAGDIVSHVGIFDQALWTVVSLPILSFWTLPPPFPVWISILYTRIQYGFLGLRQINPCRKVPLQVNFFRWRHFELPSIWILSFYFFGISCRIENKCTVTKAVWSGGFDVWMQSKRYYRRNVKKTTRKKHWG